MSSSQANRPGYIAIRLFVFMLGLLLLASTLPFPSSHAQVDPPTERLASTSKNNLIEFVPGEILVRFRDEAIADVKERAIAPLRARGQEIPIDVESFDGAEIIEGLRIARVEPEETLQAIESLNARSDVLYAEPNYVRRRDAVPNDSRFAELWGLLNTGQSGGTPDADIDADQAWNITTGSRSVVVGVVDQGIDTNHPDLQANIWQNPGETPGNGVDDDGNGFVDDVNGWDFFHDDARVFDGAGQSGASATDAHGTHVAGTIGAVGNNSVGVVGVNYQVSLMSLKIIGADGERPSSVSTTVRAYNYAVMMRNRGVNIRVLNNSYGGNGFSSTELTAIRALNEAGILFVASAGNDGSDSDGVPHYPSGYDAPNIISVAATDRSDNLASFSTFGARSVSVGAPGRSVLSTTPGNTYSIFSGTSMAAPHVAGAAALVCAQYPNINLAQLRGVLAFSGDVISPLQGKTSTGRRLNVYQSLLSAGESDVTQPATAGSFRITSQSGRNVALAWTAPGDDGSAGRAADYDFFFVNGATGTRYALPVSVLPDQPGASQSVTIYVPYRLSNGTVELRTFDNAGNFSTASVNVTISGDAIEPYAVTTSAPPGGLSVGTGLGLIGDDSYRRNYQLPFAFPFFGREYNSLTISINGALYFSSPPDGDSSGGGDLPSTVAGLTRQVMIAGMWDDLRTDGGSVPGGNGDVFITSSSNSIVFRWQGETYNGEQPINFEIELNRNGTIQSRYGGGNTGLSPVVGISGGGPNAYVVTSHTEPVTSLTNAPTVTFAPFVAPPTPANPIDDATFFVQQHYRDFFSREADASGLAFWTGRIAGCGSSAQCTDAERVNTSAAFYISTEFQQTGYLVYRLYQSAYGRQPTFAEFLPDTRAVGADVIVGQPGWENQLELNKQAFAETFVQRAAFTSEFPQTLSSGEYVDRLFTRAGLAPPSSTERQSAISAFGSGGVAGRARALRAVAENRQLYDREYNAAFVLMQYFGYLRRDADASGFNFWIGELNRTGNYSNMVRAFIVSEEYRRRFGLP